MFQGMPDPQRTPKDSQVQVQWLRSDFALPVFPQVCMHLAGVSAARRNDAAITNFLAGVSLARREDAAITNFLAGVSVAKSIQNSSQNHKEQRNT